MELFYSEEGGLSVGAAEGEDESKWVGSLRRRESGNLYIPAPDLPAADFTTSRFIGKVAFEALAKKVADVPGWNDEIVDKPELDELRRYVRLGIPRTIWPIHMRRIYPPDFLFADNQFGSHQVLHEWDILNTPAGEFYGVVAIFGVEYAVNLGGPEIDGYLVWLRQNNYCSHLYPQSETQIRRQR